MKRLAAAAIVALALWLSGAVFAPATSAPDAGWLVALPSWPALAAAAAAAALLVAWRPPSHLLALLPLVAVLLPWTPRIDAGLIYAGPLVVLVWAAVFILGWGAAAAGRIRTCSCATSARSATIAAFLIAIASTSLIAWRVAPMLPGGDEPDYLIITQSLLKDGDLRIENNHAQRDYAAYAAGEIRPQYLVRGKDGAIYPIHAPGLPALAMPAFAAGGYPGVVVFLIVVMALASALVWRIAWLATGDIAAAWFGWAIVAASCTWAFQSVLVFPDALGGAALACGLWLVLRLDGSARPEEPRRLPSSLAIAGVGAALAMLPWLHTRFAVLAGGLGLMIALRLYRAGARHAAVFLAAPAIGALAWFAFFYAIYGTPSPIAPWGNSETGNLRWIPGGLAGLMFDQQFGLLPYAPALAAGVAGLLAGTAAGWTRATRLQLAILIVAAYAAASASYAMWWGGSSVPARLLTVLLPVVAPAGAVLWLRARNPATRAALAAALGWTIFATVTLAFAGRGALAWNVRQHKAGLWFEWVAPLVTWTAALPAFFRAGDELGRESLPLPAFYAVTAVWIAAIALAIGAGALAARWMRRRTSPDAAARAITIAALVLALPAATVIALRIQRADGAAPARAQIAFLSAVSSGHRTIIDLKKHSAVSAADALASIRVSVPGGSAGERSFGSLPAGRYRIAGDPAGAEGQVVIGRGEPVATLGVAPVDIALPLDVNALGVRGAAGRALTLEPVSSLPRRSRQRATRALRYGPVTVYFVDDRAYPEAQAFWVGGSRFTNVVLQADPGVGSAVLEITNAPVPNHIDVIGAAARVKRDLAAGETVQIPIAFDANGAARLQIDSRSGFTPAEVDSASKDRRFLGVRVTVARTEQSPRDKVP